MSHDFITGRVASVAMLILSMALAGNLPAAGQTAGEADVAIQAYYSEGNNQPVVDTAGTSVAFRNFIPHLGMLKGSFQGWSNDGQFRTGDNFLELGGVAFLDRHWTFTGGDFRLSTNLVQNPFMNIYTPDIDARGFRVQATSGDRTYSFFAGAETLLQGPRIPFRIRAPQSVVGGAVQQNLGTRFEIGFRFLHLSADSASAQPLLITTRTFDSVNISTIQGLYKVRKHLTFYAEAANSMVAGADRPRHPVSVFLGPMWQSDTLTVRANYVYQGAAYLPLPGYLVGDRRGPFIDVQYRPRRSIELHGSASRYSNNLDAANQVPTLQSSTYSSGISWTLPWKLTANGDVTVIQLRAPRGNDVGALDSPNERQLTLSLARPLGRQTLRFSFFDLNVQSKNALQRQQADEIEDTLAWRHLTFAGAVRMQRALDQSSRNTLFFRTSAQLNLKQVSAYAQLQKGTDLISRTLFATNSFSSTVIGLSAPLVKGSRLQIEAFRNQMTSVLNAESIFVLENRGAAIPATLAGFNQWNLYVRISKQFRWGSDINQLSQSALQVPLVGAVEGFVRQIGRSIRDVAGVPVMLDNGRTATTDSGGRYRFIDVPEGVHEVKLAIRELPADFEPGDNCAAQVKVMPHAVARADFSVKRLASLAGNVKVPGGISPDSVIIRLLPTGRYTTPDPDGGFAFFNLPEGDYQVAIDQQSLPEGSFVQSVPVLQASVRLDSPLAPIEFELATRVIEKPIRVLFQQEISVSRHKK
ncbi:MAG: hypothetical protein ABSG52_06585 [Terriglobales bacterium]